MTKAQNLIINTAIFHFFVTKNKPVRIGEVYAALRARSDLISIRQSDVKEVIQSMMLEGQLKHSPGLKVEMAWKRC